MPVRLIARVCVCVHMCMCASVCRVCMCVCVHVCMCACAHACACACSCACACAWACVHVRVLVHVCMWPVMHGTTYGLCPGEPEQAWRLVLVAWAQPVGGGPIHEHGMGHPSQLDC